MRKNIYILIIFIIGFGSAIADTIIAPPFDNFTLGLNTGVFFPMYQSNYEFFEEKGYGIDPLIMSTIGYKIGLISIFGLNSGLSYKIGLNFSSFEFTNTSNHTNSSSSNINKEIIKVNENYIEIPIEIRKIILNDIFNLDIKPKINNIGYSFGIITGYRTINEIQYTPYNFFNKLQSIPYANKLRNYKLDLKLGLDLAQPNYIFAISYNYPIFQHLTEENNIILKDNKRAYIMFHSISVDFTLFLFITEYGKYKSIFD